jgi:hypothetical protein
MITNPEEREKASKEFRQNIEDLKHSIPYQKIDNEMINWCKKNSFIIGLVSGMSIHSLVNICMLYFFR